MDISDQGLKYLVFLFLVFAVVAIILFAVSNFEFISINGLWLILLALFLLAVWKFDFVLTLKEYQRAVIMRFGRITRVGGPGWCFMIPIIESPTVVDLRTQTIDVPRQDVITQGNIELKIDALAPVLENTLQHQVILDGWIKVND